MEISNINNEKLNLKDNKKSFYVIKGNFNNNISDIITDSRFQNLVWKIFKNKKWEELICDLKNNWKTKQLNLSNIKWKKVSELNFSYEQWFFYIDWLRSYEKWNWWLILDIFLNELWKKWVFLQDSAYSKFDDKRLDEIYTKRWFRKSKYQVWNKFKILFRWNINLGQEFKILNKYF